ncbi:hypothetical protein [Novosphingobium sp.]|uniref:hypothetical protein n=1 Tax=Novosphingobium sp. TaxID=1874826 RepID=UPI00286E4DA2|nr:hypothetical protein [Novosphingobium sp.]
MVKRAAALSTFAAIFVLSGCVQDIKASRVKSALMDGGLSESLAGCMAQRMAGKLTIHQLKELQRLNAAPRRTISEFVAALRKNGDADAIEVTLSSAALCKTGWISEKKR